MAADGELVFARLAEKIMDVFVLAVFAIRDQGMEGLIRDAVVSTPWVIARQTFGDRAFLASPGAANFTPWRRQAGRGRGDRGEWVLTPGAIGAGFGLERARPFDWDGDDLRPRPMTERREAQTERSNAEQGYHRRG